MKMSDLLFLRARDADVLMALSAAAQSIAVPDNPADPLPEEIVWMPAGTTEITAYGPGEKPWTGKVTADAEGAAAVEKMRVQAEAAGRRVYLDENHEDAAATAWVKSFRWDPARGIIAAVEWTARGRDLLRGRVYYSFSPAFLINKKTGRVAGFPIGHAAGGLVNAPAFGPAMPALIAARYFDPASAGDTNTKTKNTMPREVMLKILAAVGVSAPADATDEELTKLVAKHADKITAKKAATEDAEDAEEVKAKLAELESLKAREAARVKADAKKAVDDAVARGALPPKDEKVQAKWRALIEANPDNAELLAGMPGNKALQRVTTPGMQIEAKDGLVESLRAMAANSELTPLERGRIYGREVAPLFAKDADFALGPILAANSLGTLSGELITQRSLSLLKRTYPALFAISTDFSSENAAFNQTVKTRLRTIPAVTPYHPVTGYATSDATTTDVPIVIDAHNAVQITFNANELASTNRDLFGEQVEGAHAAIGGDLMDAILALLTAANFPSPANTTTVTLANFARASMTGIGKKMTDRLVPRAGRFAMLNTAYYEKLGQDSSIVSLATYQQSRIITENELPRVAKFQPYEVEAFPTTGNLTGFAGAPDALAIATRVPNDYTKVMPDADGGGTVQTVVNPDTGISAMLVRFVNHRLGAAVWRLAYMRGAGIGNAKCGERIISAAP